MRIQLKQIEIEEAIKNYLSRQGIAVSGKSVTMDFTSGRKNNGLSVEVVIEDVAVPPLEATYEEKLAASQMPAPDAALAVQDGVLAGSDNLSAPAQGVDPAEAPVDQTTVAPESDTKVETPAEEAKPVGSLFG